MIREIATINKLIAGRSRKEYYNENITKIKEQYKDYRTANKEYILEKSKEYSKNNQDKIKERNKIKCECSICGALVRKYDLKRHQSRNICNKNKMLL